MNGQSELLFVNPHGILDVIGGYDWKFLRSPSEISNLFECACSSSERLYCIV